jgi:hypothetical protein
LPINFDQSSRVFSDRSRFGSHSDDCFTLPGSFFEWQGVLRGGLEAFQVGQHTYPRVMHFRHFVGGNNRNNTPQLLGG